VEFMAVTSTVLGAALQLIDAEGDRIASLHRINPNITGGNVTNLATGFGLINHITPETARLVVTNHLRNNATS
jgi:hypothetical protein